MQPAICITASIATPEMAEIFDFFAISRMLEKHWHQPQADCLFFGTCDTATNVTIETTAAIDAIGSNK